MSIDRDWRYDNIEHLRGATFRFADYKAPSDHWDHDHCNGCWAKFASFDGPDVLHCGYLTAIPYSGTNEPELISEWMKEGIRCIPQPVVDGFKLQWVCKECFEDFRSALGFTLVGP